ELNFYYSTFFHYANNFSIPEAGSYTLRVKVEAPTFNRHGDADETPPLAEGVEVEFTDVELGPQ
ncbi:iron transporter, partial [Nocardioides sp. GCM10030258]